MNEDHTVNLITRDKYDAVLFDLDGVLTNTAHIHATCWKKIFDEYLQARSTKIGETFRSFDIATDYKLHVDGKPRFDGVRDFLKSRGIDLPEGTHDDPPHKETVCGIGNRKSNLVAKVIKTDGIEVYKGSMAFLRHVREKGMKTAVVTSSENCQAVLQTAGIRDLFDAQIDGTTIVSQHLAGKPAPDSYLKAAQLLEVQPNRAVVIEDAISGIQAGVKGSFGLVIGIDRKGNAEELKNNGAHIVVSDLSECIQ